MATYNEIAADFTHVRLLFRIRFGLCCLLLLPDCTYIHVGLGYMSKPALLKEINELLKKCKMVSVFT